MKRAALLAMALCGCSSSQPASKSPQQVQAVDVYALRSNVTGYSLVRLAALPAISAPPYDQASNCVQPQQPVSTAAKLAVQKGWRILAEQKFHQFQAVLIARAGEPMTSARCNYVDSNVAFFEGDRLVGILYPKGKDASPIAGIELVGDHLRAWSTDPTALGQANLRGADLTFDAISGDDLVCNGLHVPAIFEQRYSQARQKLMAAGWSAQPSTEEVMDDRTRDYRKRFPETDSCAGTGYAECRFSLIAKNRTIVAVTTMGEDDDPVVSSYTVTCARKRSTN